MKTKKAVYMVTYKDDFHKTHITFVEGFSAVKFLEDRFDNVYFEPTDTYPREKEDNQDYEKLLFSLI